jgi:hypothetical protein
MQANNNQNKLFSFCYGSDHCDNVKPSRAVTEFITQNLSSTRAPSTLQGPSAPGGPSGSSGSQSSRTDTAQQIKTRWETDSDQCSKGDFRL